MKRMTFRAGTEWDAEDIIQETYARAIQYFSSYDGKHIDQWISTILNNTLRDYKNSEKGFAATSFEEEEMDGTPCSYFSERVVDEINALIDTKSVVQIEVLSMYFRHGFSAIDIQKITEYPYKFTHQIIQRFKNELKELYG